MPKGIRIAPDVKRAIIAQYYSGEKTVKQICYEYGVKGRTIYDWIEVIGHGARVHNPKDPRRAVWLSSCEVELILLMMAECEKILNRQNLAIMRNLEDRLLNVADELTEISAADRIDE